MATFDIEPIHPDFGAKITGIDLREPLDEATLVVPRRVFTE